MADHETQERSSDGGVATAQDTLSVTDNRTGKTYELEIKNGTVRAMDLRGIKTADDDFGLMTYDPAFTNTAAASQRDHLHRRRRRRARVPRLLDRASSASRRPTSRSPIC